MNNYTFQQYLLFESISLIQCNFGTNEAANDSKLWKHNDPSDYIETLLVDGSNYYLIVLHLDSTEVKFFGCDHYSTNVSEYTLDRLNSSNPGRLFGKIFYIVAVLVNKLHLSGFEFAGVDIKLNSLYNRIVNNIEFNKQMNQVNLNYVGIHNNMFKYETIK